MADLSTWQLIGYIASIGSLIIGTAGAIVFLGRQFIAWRKAIDDTPDQYPYGDVPHVHNRDTTGMGRRNNV